MGMSLYLKDLVKNSVFNGSQTQINSWYMALYTTTPTDASSGVEVDLGEYSRVGVTAWTPSSEGTIQNSAGIQFAFTADQSNPIVGAGLFDQSSGGNRLYQGALGVPITNPVSGDTITIASKDALFTFAS